LDLISDDLAIYRTSLEVWVGEPTSVGSAELMFAHSVVSTGVCTSAKLEKRTSAKLVPRSASSAEGISI
jgi:hypothetical protein